MFAIGHLALGYITGKITSHTLKINANIPLLLVASVAPDIDLLIPWIEHRGPTHSIVLLLLVSIPLIMIWKKQAIPFTVSLISHPLLGDYFTSMNCNQGVQLLFPLSKSWYYGNFGLISSLAPIIEIFLLGAMLILLFAIGDIKFLTQPHSLNFVLAIPSIAALLPVFTHFPIPVPTLLVIPHILLVALLTIPMFIAFKIRIIDHNKTSDA
jgi:membrane-bound metal-dependent hydrolase YbcI (DUF457 family)